MTATRTGRASFRFIPLDGLRNSIPHPMAFTLLILNNTLRWLIFWSIMQVLMTILLHLPLPLCINFTSTLSPRTLRVIQKTSTTSCACLLPHRHGHLSLWTWFPSHDMSQYDQRLPCHKQWHFQHSQHLWPWPGINQRQDGLAEA